MKRKGPKKKGSPLFDQVIHLTGIPTKQFKKDLKQIAEKKNLDPDSLTIDQLRRVAASYLRQIMSSILDSGQEKKS
ncbi:MAG: hypothetical protein HY537_05390 [Deltaproteobacteria bacterium]|nr:hypothetical protein [Deltaproteobacteria bacterium]